LGSGIVAEAGKEAHRHAGIHAGAHVGIRRERAFDAQGTGFDLTGEVGGDAAAERATERDNPC
jgi:hypothetical protein